MLEHSAILLTFIKLPLFIKIFVLSIFEWPFYTGFTVYAISNSMCGSRGENRGSGHKKGFLSNTGTDHLKNRKATKPAFNVRPSSACQRKAI